MGINLSYIEGQTPIDEDEKSGLKIKTITTRNELDEWEQLNIEDAIKWSIKIKKTAEDLITADFVRDLICIHECMGESGNGQDNSETLIKISE